MPGGGEPFGGGVQATDDGRRTHLPGAAEGTGAMQGLWGGGGYGIIGGAQDDTAWTSGRGVMDLENLGHGGKAAYVPHGLPVQGRPTDLPGGGMPRTSDNEDGDAGTFHAPACTGYRGNFGGGKHPPPTVPPMQHAGPLAYTERKAPCHRTVLQGIGAGEAAVSRGGIEVEHGEVH